MLMSVARTPSCEPDAPRHQQEIIGACKSGNVALLESLLRTVGVR